jgi:hypothetical protein
MHGAEDLKDNLVFQTVLKLPQFQDMLSFSMANLFHKLQLVHFTLWQSLMMERCTVGARPEWANSELANIMM